MQTTGLELITVIIVTYNSASCLQQAASNLSKFPNIILVDNASQDDIRVVHQQSLPHAKLIRLSENRGFGAANNAALMQLQTPFALLLNPDCTLSVCSVLKLLEVATVFPQAAIVAPQVSRPDGTAEISYRWPARVWMSKGPAADALCSVGFVTGAVMLLRISSFRDVGFFDEAFFLYYEDEDLCYRLFKAKRSILLTPEAQAVHASRSSVKDGFPWRSEYIRGFHHAQSKLIFEAKHGSRSVVQGLRLRVLILAMLSLPLRILWPQPRYLVRLSGRIGGMLAWSSKATPSNTES
ncbi:MAG: glycosyltransferase family 2 protein [Burkholderiales bacterium]|nr:MAG: glycosyltransferase family 2 protein [Burkholderiales bacterium]